MADNLKITQAPGARTLDEFGREHSEKLQALARGLVSGLYMLVRSVKMYDPDNAVFEKPLAAAAGHDQPDHLQEGKLELVGVKDSFYLNNMLVKVDLNALDNSALPARGDAGQGRGRLHADEADHACRS